MDGRGEAFKKEKIIELIMHTCHSFSLREKGKTEIKKTLSLKNREVNVMIRNLLSK